MNYVEQTCSRKEGATHEKLFRKFLCCEMLNGRACNDFAEAELRFNRPDALTLIMGRGFFGLAHLFYRTIAGSIEMAAAIGTLKLKISSGKGRRFYGHPEATCGSSKEHQKSREGGKTKTNFKTFAEENPTSPRPTGGESQTITRLSMKRDSTEPLI